LSTAPRVRNATPAASPDACPLVWLDGRIVPAAQASLSPLDRGLLFGDAIFETVRVYDGRLFAWPEHERRLRAALRRFAFPPVRVRLPDAMRELLAATGVRDAAVRVTVTRGASDALVPPPALRPTVLITARGVPAGLAVDRERGIAAVLLPFGHGRGGITQGHKTTAYLPAVLGRLHAARARAQEGIFVEDDGSVSEATTSNVFAVRRGTIVTPPLAAGCLPGITREACITIARRHRVPLEERPLAARRLAGMDEIFLTGSVIEVLPVVRLDGGPIGDGRPGPLTRLLRERYRSFVERSLARRP
jgi:branched-subunit amino acid aminotransferase/4-amino-4-deoxychorismate lyase